MPTIKVLVQENGQLTTSSSGAVKSGIKQTTQQSQQSNAVSKTAEALKMTASSMKSYCLSNVGKWTGSSYNQTQVNYATQMVGLGYQIYNNPSIAIANIALSVATQAYELAYQRKWENRELNNQRQRAGYTITTYTKGR